MTAKLDLSPCPLPVWLPGGHLQTIYSAYCAQHHNIAFVRERVDTPDGDFVDLDWAGPGLFADRLADGTMAGKDAHLQKTAARRWLQPEDWKSLTQHHNLQALVLFHGLEGSSNSHYAQAIAQYFRARGWVVVVAHFRGCSGFPNRMARAYYSGDSEEIAFMLQTVRQRLPQASWHTVGVSLGGNAMLKHLGEHAEQTDWIKASAAVSVPTDLVACGERLSTGFVGRYIYCPYFLHSMKSKIFDKSRRFPGMIDILRLNHARTLRDFDDVYTAPMHGFKHALEYWTKSSSKQFLNRIQIPTLVLNARNDPFVPPSSLPTLQDVSEHVVLHQPSQGGHVGFTTGAFPGNINWLPARLALFFETGQ
ncbi:alpha/beta fold hydrolase [Alcaligenaceae bacterium 429]|nr:alpha/beta fold hydrolase [Alcaligenaceae bacterium 429]